MKREQLIKFLREGRLELWNYDKLNVQLNIDEVIREDCSLLKDVNNNLRDNFQFMKKMVNINPFALMYASQRLKSHKKLVLEAIQKDSFAFIIADESLKDNDDFILKSLESATVNYEPIGIFMSDRLKNDREFALKVLDIKTYLFLYFSDILKDDTIVVLKAVSNCGVNIIHASDRLKNFKPVVLEAVMEDAFNFIHVGDVLKSDKDFILECLKLTNNSVILLNLKESILNDKKFMMQTISIVGDSLQYASDVLKDDDDVLRMAIECDAKTIVYASKRLRNDARINSLVIKNLKY